MFQSHISFQSHPHILRSSKQIPSGKRLHSYGKSPLDGKNHYFYGHVQQQTVSLPEGHPVIPRFLWCWKAPPRQHVLAHPKVLAALDSRDGFYQGKRNVTGPVTWSQMITPKKTKEQIYIYIHRLCIDICTYIKYMI